LTHDPQPLNPAHDFYPARHATLTIASQALATRATRLRIALTTLGLLTLVPIYTALRGTTPAWHILIPFLVALLVLNLYLRARRQQLRILRLLAFYNRALDRVTGTKTQSGHTGEEFRDPAHLYDHDLAIFGPDSLFGLLATVRTGVGQHGLAQYLLHPPTREETLLRQQAIEELTPRNDLREAIGLLGVTEFQQIAATFFDQWLDEPPPIFHPAIRYVLLAFTTLLAALTAAGLSHLAPWSTINPNLLAILAAQSVLGMYLRPRVLTVLNAPHNLANQMEMFRDGLALLQNSDLRSSRLRALQTLSREPASAIPLLKELQSPFVIVEQRTKEWYLILSLFLNAGTHAVISIANWKRQHAASMKQWLAVWAEFEALNALATYAYEHPANIYPEILPTGTSTYEATALAHPLLPAAAVANDITLNEAHSLDLISGSNMAGKSTLLRAIGCNAVLAFTGAPIRATAARISPLRIGASIALTDSLAEGKSKFLAEVERLHAILQASEAGPLLFLIDEIFSGTNSLDRRIAAEAVARALTAHHAIGALSTHDLTLTEMAANPALRAVNVHMASPNPADPLAFDYRLKPGINPTTNALAILRLIGINTDVNTP
jgi:hypothetical protein